MVVNLRGALAHALITQARVRGICAPRAGCRRPPSTKTQRCHAQTLARSNEHNLSMRDSDRRSEPSH
eukprot:881372-Pyramimonas_sp.AAC.1